MHRHDGDTAELRKMYLARPTRGRGIGKWMLEQALADARQPGYRRVLSGTATALHEAIALYQRYGFKPIGAPAVAPRCDLMMALEF
ncbi:MAG: GNAT family N-acetyltransferase [Pedosphaera sp.]|nr:GNAT family N-acetyltransferase [Pedosphaera sp.]